MRGQGYPMTMIVIAAILLVAMVIILTLFSRGTGRVETGLTACAQQGGKCMSSEDCGSINGRPAVFLICENEQVCCFGGG